MKRKFARTLTAETLERLASLAEEADRSADWPVASWEAVHAGGVLGWSLPPKYGGQVSGWWN